MQRSAVSSQSVLEVLLAGLYEAGGPDTEDTEDAGLMFTSVPIPMLKRLHFDATKGIKKGDANLQLSMKKAGFTLDDGPDDCGLFVMYSSEVVATTSMLGAAGSS